MQHNKTRTQQDKEKTTQNNQTNIQRQKTYKNTTRSHNFLTCTTHVKRNNKTPFRVKKWSWPQFKMCYCLRCGAVALHSGSKLGGAYNTTLWLPIFFYNKQAVLWDMTSPVFTQPIRTLVTICPKLYEQGKRDIWFVQYIALTLSWRMRSWRELNHITERWNSGELPFLISVWWIKEQSVMCENDKRSFSISQPHRGVPLQS